jgi:hypothetical protein
MDADANPFPSDETTPPVTKMNLLMVSLPFGVQTTLIRMTSSSTRRHPFEP